MSAWRATSASPVLPSFDFAATAAFYGRLGFSVVRQGYAFFLRHDYVLSALLALCQIKVDVA